jgi:hypothetical protein
MPKMSTLFRHLCVYQLILTSLCGTFTGVHASQSGKLEMENLGRQQVLELQQGQYRRKLEALENLSASERRRLDRQLQRQRLKQRQLDQRELFQSRFSPRVPARSVAPPTYPSPQSLQPQRSQELQFKIERESWHYPAGSR